MISYPILWQIHFDGQLNFAQEIEKLPVIKLSVLQLKFEWACHVYGALVLRLLQMHRVCAAMEKLMVVLGTTQKVIHNHAYRFFIHTISQDRC